VEYQDDVQGAAEIIRLVLPTLSRLGIPANPINFAIWYQYYLGSNEELNAALDEVSQGAKPLSAEESKELFLRHVVNPGAAKMERIGEEVRRLLFQAGSMMEAAGSEVGHFGEVLNDSSSQLGAADDIQSVKRLMSSLMEETNTMLDSNKKFEEELRTATQEMTLLREELSEMRKQAALDALTGLANRRTFDETLQRAVDTASTGGEDLCLMMVDIDHFKKINDQHGHLIGDKVLKFVAATLKKLVKGKDVVARYGGEEFGIILENTPRLGAMTVAETIRQTVEASNLRRTDTDEPLGTITVSIGLESYRRGDTPDSLIERADKALYHSKNTGRNRVTSLENAA
jgi:diguanylate cyclase